MFGTPDVPTNPLHVGQQFRGYHGSLLLRPVNLLASLGGSDRDSFPADRDVYTQASDELVTLLVAEYDYDGSWAASIGGTLTRKNSS